MMSHLSSADRCLIAVAISVVLMILTWFDPAISKLNSRVLLTCIWTALPVPLLVALLWDGSSVDQTLDVLVYAPAVILIVSRFRPAMMLVELWEDDITDDRLVRRGYRTQYAFCAGVVVVVVLLAIFDPRSVGLA